MYKDSIIKIVCPALSIYFNQQYTSSLHYKMCLNMVLCHYLFNNFPCWMFKSLKSYHYYKWYCEGHLYASTFAYISYSFLSIDSWRWNCSFKDDICKVLMHVSGLVSRKIAGVSPALHSIIRKVTVKKKKKKKKTISGASDKFPSTQKRSKQIT